MNYSVVLRTLMGSDCVRKETDAYERKIKISLEPSWCFFNKCLGLEITSMHLATWSLCCLLFERMRGLPKDCCMPDRALCCFEQQGGPSCKFKGNSKKRGSKELGRQCLILCVSFNTCYGTGRVQGVGIYYWGERSSHANMWETLIISVNLTV